VDYCGVHWTHGARQGGCEEQALCRQWINDLGPRVCMCIHTRGESCSELGRVLLLKNPAARWFHDTLLDADLAVNSMVWFMCFV